MTFDKSKVCVAGIHDVPVETKGYYSDEICNLRDYVNDDDKDMYGTIIKEPQDDWYKLIDKDVDSYWRFFYPCEEQVKQYRPYATIEEAMVLKGKWMKSKDGKILYSVTSLWDTSKGLYIDSYSSQHVFDTFTFEDGTPVGVEV
jgi:hypothetical protein